MGKSLSWCRARLENAEKKEIDSNNTSAKLTQQFLGPGKSELGRALSGSQEGYQASQELQAAGSLECEQENEVVGLSLALMFAAHNRCLTGYPLHVCMVADLQGLPVPCHRPPELTH